ncbi:MAG TPA: collagen-like protein [Rhizobiaceae bacterium]|nr:collagen-like protein [Rhizobiaceae bacterium]
MANPNIYATGTVSVTAGGTSVTGTDTGWLTFGVAGGTLVIDGLSVPIASVDSETSLTLEFDWPGSTVTDGVYSIGLVGSEASSLIQFNTKLTNLITDIRTGTYADIFSGHSWGSLAERDDFDTRERGFAYLDVMTDPFGLYVRSSDTPGEWEGPNSFGQGPQGETGPEGPQGDTGATGPAGADGSDPGILFNFDTATADADPGSGDLRANNASLTSATVLYVSKTSRGGSNVATWLATLDDSTNTTVKGIITLADPASEAQVVYNLTALTDSTNYVKLTVTAGAGATSFANALPISFQFSRAGDKGADGAGTGDVVGPGSATDNAVARFDATTGKLIQNSTVTISDTGLVAGASNLPRSDTSNGFTAAQQAQLRANTSAALKGQIFGLTLSNNTTDATNDIDIAAGEAASTESDPVLMVLASTLTKRLDTAWAVGSGNGGRDTGSIANGTWHVWLIQRSDTGVVDALFSLSATSPTMPTNYDRKRRVGSVIRMSSALVAFKQLGDDFRLSVPAQDANAVVNPGTSAVLLALSVPGGIQVEAGITFTYADTSAVGGTAILVTSPDQANTAPDFAARYGQVLGSQAQAGATQELRVRTDTSQQMRYRLSQSTADHFIYVVTHGWTDTRGRNA